MTIASWKADAVKVPDEPAYLIGWDDGTGELVIYKDDWELFRVRYPKAKDLSDRISAFNPRKQP